MSGAFRRSSGHSSDGFQVFTFGDDLLESCSNIFRFQTSTQLKTFWFWFMKRLVTSFLNFFKKRVKKNTHYHFELFERKMSFSGSGQLIDLINHLAHQVLRNFKSTQVESLFQLAQFNEAIGIQIHLSKKKQKKKLRQFCPIKNTCIPITLRYIWCEKFDTPYEILLAMWGTWYGNKMTNKEFKSINS